MPVRGLPVRPNLEQLRHQAKDLLAAARAGDASALDDFRAFHPAGGVSTTLQLHDAQLVLARSYQCASWPRLVQACELADAIWRDDLDAVRDLVTRHAYLRDEQVLVRLDSNWGPPMSYAANLGRDRIIRWLHEHGATDHQHALDRAVLQSQVNTATMLYEMLGKPQPPQDALGGAAYTLSVPGTEFLLQLGVRVVDDAGRRLAPVDVVLETDSRKPAAKHAILRLYEEHGVVYPDTPVMAVHRGRVDLLAAHVQRDPAVVNRCFSFAEMYPPELGCHDEVNATHGTPLGGTTLLHLCIDYDELEIARWLLANGANPNIRASVGADGYGGHTALFATVVSQPAFWMNYGHRPLDATFTQLLLEHGAEVNVRCSLRKQLHWGYGRDEVMQYYPNVTPLSWGRQFRRKEFVNGAALAVIEAAGGVE